MAFVLTGCAHDADPEAVPLRPGRLLTWQPLTSAAALPSAASNRLISYVSEDSHGQPVVVSGTVAVPRSQPPEDGRPVISWAHGTTGYTDICAPSTDFDDGPEHDYLGPVSTILDSWVASGFVVVQTDYQGLGTPGGHPYVNGVGEAHDVTDIVRAARQLDPSIGTRWVAMGHSQGGQAALFTATDAPGRAPRLQLKGAVAIAPGSGLGQTVSYVEADRPGSQSAEPFLPLLVLGAAVADPAIDPNTIFAPQFKPFVAAARSQCLNQLRELPPIPAREVFAPEADLRSLTDYLARQEPGGLTPQVPVMIAQGLDDTAVQPANTDQLIKTYCDKQLDVTYHTYSGVDHRGAVAASVTDAQQFVREVMGGHRPVNTCAGP